MPRTQPPAFPAAPAAPPAIILTAGDVSVDWLWFDLNPTDHDALRAGWEAGHPNTYRKWVHRAQVVNAAVHGGAWYLDTLVRMLAGFEHEEYVFGYARYSSAHLRMLTTNQFVHTDTGYELQDYTPGSRDKDAKPPKGVYRVKNGPTFSGPMDHAHAPVPRLTGEPAGPFVVKAAADRKARDQAPRPRRPRRRSLPRPRRPRRRPPPPATLPGRAVPPAACPPSCSSTTSVTGSPTPTTPGRTCSTPWRRKSARPSRR